MAKLGIEYMVYKKRLTIIKNTYNIPMETRDQKKQLWKFSVITEKQNEWNKYV